MASRPLIPRVPSQKLHLRGNPNSTDYLRPNASPMVTFLSSNCRLWSREMINLLGSLVRDVMPELPILTKKSRLQHPWIPSLTGP